MLTLLLYDQSLIRNSSSFSNSFPCGEVVIRTWRCSCTRFDEDQRSSHAPALSGPVAPFCPSHLPIPPPVAWR
ncbi:hypothetical protein, partial [Methanoculleus sp. UBA374]|uniref:hypothetical protein n=1 Tax=Methanoculleus sp. UBA374 TaxID=1915505 RepID=UPI00319E0331